MTTKPTRWLADKFGRRGAVLTLLGCAFILVGVDILLAPDPPNLDALLLHTLMPSWLRATLWIIPGGLAVWAAFRRTGHDFFGFAALTVPLIIRIVSYTWATVAWLLGYGDWPMAWASALIWLLILGFVLTVAGWGEVCPPRPGRRKKGGGNAP